MDDFLKPLSLASDAAFFKAPPLCVMAMPMLGVGWQHRSCDIELRPTF